MSIRSYLEPRPSGGWALAMPAVGPIMGQGIAVQGRVLEGRMRLDEALVLDRIRAIRCDGTTWKRTWDELDRAGFNK